VLNDSPAGKPVDDHVVEPTLPVALNVTLVIAAYWVKGPTADGESAIVLHPTLMV
jgi:hypothetical protein